MVNFLKVHKPPGCFPFLKYLQRSLLSSQFIHSLLFIPAPASHRLFLPKIKANHSFQWQTDVSLTIPIPIFLLYSLFPVLVLRYQMSECLIRVTVNEQRAARVAELLSDFRVLQHYIAAAPVDPQDQDDYYAEGWVALRQCYTDGQHVLNSAAETRVPRARGGPEEQAKAELQQYV